MSGGRFLLWLLYSSWLSWSGTKILGTSTSKACFKWTLWLKVGRGSSWKPPSQKSNRDFVKCWIVKHQFTSLKKVFLRAACRRHYRGYLSVILIVWFSGFLGLQVLGKCSESCPQKNVVSSPDLQQHVWQKYNMNDIHNLKVLIVPSKTKTW